jgi:hypothetical protein
MSYPVTTRTAGEPLRELMAAVGTADPQLLVVGARGTSGVRQLLLGSVAEGAFDEHVGDALACHRVASEQTCPRPRFMDEDDRCVMTTGAPPRRRVASAFLCMRAVTPNIN